MLCRANRLVFGVFLIVFAVSGVLGAQGYMEPPGEIKALVDAVPTPAVSISPDGKRMLLLQSPGYPSLAEVSEPELRVAGYRVNPKTFGPSRSGSYIRMQVKPLNGETARDFSGFPANARFSSVVWSPDGSKAAFIMKLPQGLQVWVADMVKETVAAVSPVDVSQATGAAPFAWLADGKRLVYKALPPVRLPIPQEDQVPSSPVIQETAGSKGAIRTYQDLLKNSYDERLFTYYFTCVPVLIDLNGTRKQLGEPALYTGLNPSPDMNYVLIDYVKPPFSYLVPAPLFPSVTEVRDLSGNLIKTIADRPLADNLPKGAGAVRTGPRNVGWRSDAAATLYWVEAQDGGDPAKQVAVRDRLYLWSAPFGSTPAGDLEFSLRFSGILWGNDKLAVATERWVNSRKEITTRFEPGKASTTKKVVFNRLYEDRYGDPGRFQTGWNAAGKPVLSTPDNGKTLFLTGNGASAEGDRPFLDEFEVANGKTKRIFQSEAPFYAYVVDLVDVKARKFVIRKESATEPPNFYLSSTKKNDVVALTAFTDPYPGLAGVKKQVVQYKRKDGLALKGDLYLPAGYNPEKDGRLPVLMWAYPGEYKTAAAAAQVTGSPYTFVQLSWGTPLYWVTRGYAVFNNVAMPVIGEGKTEPNDTFREQIVMNAEAAIQVLDDMKIADVDKIGVGGHSYGAFMTANLLAHSNLFAAGIARSGAYNRTLTPFGFQAEERTFWDAPETYAAMSPFFHAEKINEPLLMIHGEADNNSGTFPIQSERLYAAIKGLGGTARLVMLPNESHGYSARESILHTLYEMDMWLEKHVKAGRTIKRENKGE